MSSAFSCKHVVRRYSFFTAGGMLWSDVAFNSKFWAQSLEDLASRNPAFSFDKHDGFDGLPRLAISEFPDCGSQSGGDLAGADLLLSRGVCSRLRV